MEIIFFDDEDSTLTLSLTFKVSPRMMSVNEPFALLLDTLITLEASSDVFLELTVSAKENEATKKIDTKTINFIKHLYIYILLNGFRGKKLTKIIRNLPKRGSDLKASQDLAPRHQYLHLLFSVREIEKIKLNQFSNLF